MCVVLGCNIQIVGVIFEILLEAGQLHKFALFRSLLHTLSEVIVMLVHGV